MTVTYHEDALIDLQEAIQYYSQVSWKLTAEFETEFQSFLTTVRTNPFHYHFTKNKRHRRANLKRFPYRILYRFNEETSTIRILAICHDKRHPSFGLNRQ